jgi:CarD family transcriptional regulator
MAARKKVTKKASSSSAKSATIRSARKDKPASGRKKTANATPQTGKTKKAKDKLKTAKVAPAAKAKAKAAVVHTKSKAPAAKPATSKAATGKTPANVKKVEKIIVAKSEKTQAKKPQVETVEVSKNEVKLAPVKVVSRDEAAGAEPTLKRVETAAAPAQTVVKPVVSPPVAAPAVAPRPAPETVAKTVKAPAPTKSVDRDLQGGEQKIMKNNGNKHGFKLNEFVVYPAHGVGQIVSMEEQEVAGFRLELFVINFVKDKMTLRVPTSKVTGVGMRKLSDPEQARRSLEILTGRARIKRTMWSRRAQEYEAKINSGDINAIAEVVRDLYRSEAQPEQSYSERQLYEAALDRMMREIAAVQKISETETLKLIDTQLRKNQKRLGAKPEGAEGEEAGIEEAA